MMTDPVLRNANLQKAHEGVKNRPLTWKMKRFIAEYLADPGRNISAAADRAGYKNVDTNDLINNPKIKSIIEEENAKVLQQLEITRDRVLQELANIAFAALPDYLSANPDDPSQLQVDLSAITKQQGAVLKDYSIDEKGKPKIVLYDKLVALQTLGKYLRLEEFNSSNKTVVSISFLDKILAGDTEVKINVST